MIRDIYQIYSKKSLKKNKVFKYACVISIILAVSILFSMQNILDAYNSNLSNRIVAMNGSEVKVFDKNYLEHEFSQEQMVDLEKKLTNTNYTLAFCDNSNLVVHGSDDMASLVVFNKKESLTKFGINSLDAGEIVISKNIAKRLNIHIGDKVYIKLHSTQYRDDEFEVVQILNDTAYFSVAGSEYEIAQETLGCIYIVLPEFERFNTVYVENADDRVLNTLKEIFGSTFEVRTLQELKSIVQPRVQLQMEILKLISSIAMLISSICLVWSFYIFILDRKDDFLIFKKIGLRSVDLSKLLLLEMYAIIAKGIILGIPFGGLMTMIYFRLNGIMVDFTVYGIFKNIIMVILLVLIEAAVCAMIPVSSITKIINGNNISTSVKIPILTKILVGTIIMLLSCVYVKSFSGIVFFGVVGAIFGIFYLMFTALVKAVIKILSYKENKNFLLVSNLKSDMKIISIPLNIINVGMVIFLILISVLPMLYSPIKNGTTKEKLDITYRTKEENHDIENILNKENISFYKSYIGEAKVLKINGFNIEESINLNVSA